MESNSENEVIKEIQQQIKLDTSNNTIDFNIDNDMFIELLIKDFGEELGTNKYNYYNVFDKDKQTAYYCHILDIDNELIIFKDISIIYYINGFWNETN